MPSLSNTPTPPGLKRLSLRLAVLGHHSYRSASLRSGHLLPLSCPKLTTGEYEVLDLLAQGMTDREIAEALTVSEQTSRT